MLTEFLHGQTDEPLNERGLLQADLLGSRLNGTHFDLVFASDLSRALKTAEAIVGRKPTTTTSVVIHKDKLLRERFFGQFENRPFQDFYDAANEAGHTTDIGIWQEFADGTAESMDDVMVRSEIFWNKLLKLLSEKDEPNLSVLVASHGIWIRMLMTYLASTGKVSGIPPADEIRYHRGTCPNTGLTKLSVAMDKSTSTLQSATCQFMYCAKHLDEPNASTTS